MEIFPYFIIRISSGEYRRLNSLRHKKAYKYVLEINEYELKLDSIIPNLCNSIYYIIPSIKRKKDRDILIESKRDIYNRRNVSSEAIEMILSYVKTRNFCKRLL